MNSISSSLDLLCRCHSRYYYCNYCNSSLFQIITFCLVFTCLGKQILKFVIIIIYLINCHNIVVHYYCSSSLPNCSSFQSCNSSFFQIPIFLFFVTYISSYYLPNIIVMNIIIHYYCNYGNMARCFISSVSCCISQIKCFSSFLS